MKLQRIIAVLVVIIIIGIAIFLQVLIRSEKRHNSRNLQSTGRYLVSLIAMNSIKDFSDEKRAFFLRTLTEYTSSEGIVYFFIHDNTGKTIASLAPGNIQAQIPAEVQVKSLLAKGSTEQTFKIVGINEQIFEL
ncbi:MAG: hypothetical protein JRD68_11705 [Deltaproteobacteria bacterium]|nr:hypothetical protein [Deltaproteobacteria bacterium]